jgi:hypothetical protein
MRNRGQPLRSPAVVICCFVLLTGGTSLLSSTGGPVVSAAPYTTETSAEAPSPDQPERNLGEPVSSRTLAVIYRREGDGRLLSGAVKSIIQAAEVEAAMAVGTAGRDAAAEHATHEIWLVGSGTTRGFWYSEDHGAYGVLDRDGVGLGHYHQEFRRLVKLAAIPRALSHRQPNVVLDTYPGAGTSIPLAELTRESHIIAIGTVLGIVREAFTPVNGSGPRQHTVYALAVHEYLKAGSEVEPPVLKVYQSVGTLPFVFHAADGSLHPGAGFHLKDDPPLLVGADYLLFLRMPDISLHRQRGYRFGGHNGVYGKIAELDEYVTTALWRGKVLIKDGYTWSPDADGRPLTMPLPEEKRVREGPEILGQPVREAVRLVREALEAMVIDTH